MRPQQNRRMRGRGNNNNNNNNRKGPNPLTRSYESNGPDVKIRGTAQQIADKYGTLARDAQSSGDRVIAENYLQHAEHYNRIIMAAQAQQQAQQPRPSRDDDEMFEEREDGENENSEDDAPQTAGSGPQPVVDGTPAEIALKDGNQQRAERDRAPRDRGEARDEDSKQPEDRAQINGAPAQADAAPAEAAPRRPRRPRRPRQTDDAQGGSGDQPASQDGSESVTEAAQ